MLRLGHVDTALQLLDGLSSSGHHADELLRLQSWALLMSESYGALARSLDGEEGLTPELVYLRGVARWRSMSPGALEDLRALWWERPATVWALGALRELGERPLRDGGVYPDSERELLLGVLPTATMDSGVDAEAQIEALLTNLADAHRAPGLLAAELHHAWGVLLLESDEFTPAAAAFRRALARAPPSRLHRAVELNLAETLRRRGNYAHAMQRFKRVYSSEEGTLADRALAAAGQMAIENQRYPDARAHFEAALVKNPVGRERHRALWGLGWVAFRTGDFASAIQFFRSLELEAPYGPLVPRARYWRARSLEESSEPVVARALMLSLTEHFPVDYYSYRAAEWLGSKHLRDTEYPNNPASQHPRVSAAASLFRAGMPIRATRALKRALGAADALGPHELLQLEAMASQLDADRTAERLRLAREHRFPLGEDARRSLRQLYPSEHIELLFDQGRRYRLSPSILVAVARRESRFNPRAVSSVGAVGLLQLLPKTAVKLLAEERRKLGSPQMLMDPELNSRLAARYLGRMLRAFDRRKEYGLAAYHAGPGAVTRWRASRGDLPVDIFVEEIPYLATQEYVRDVLAALRAFEFATSDVPVDELPHGYDALLTARLEPGGSPPSQVLR